MPAEQRHVDDNDRRYGADVTDLFVETAAGAPQAAAPLPRVVIYTDERASATRTGLVGGASS